MSQVDKNPGGEPTVALEIRTPRGVWNMIEPPNALKRPKYPVSTKIAQVIADAREVFGFVEDDNKYQLLHGTDRLEPQHPLARYHFKNGTVLVLTVQGGNAHTIMDPNASLEAIRNELEEAAQFAVSAGLKLDASKLTSENPVFSVVFSNRAGESFFARFDCKDYPMLPPFIEFTDEAGASAGRPDLYPNVFHPTPCVCMRYNRKAYKELGGPHNDWRMIDWHLATSGGGPIGSLALIVSDLHAKILDSAGRM
jgi:hypothetical protein